jgi:hypothetical protein
MEPVLGLDAVWALAVLRKGPSARRAVHSGLRSADHGGPGSEHDDQLSCWQEIWRVLKPGALYQGTMLPTRNINYGRGRTVAPDTFVVDGAGSDCAGNP